MIFKRTIKLACFLAPLEQSSSSVEVFPKEKRQQTCWLISLGRKINEGIDVKDRFPKPKSDCLMLGGKIR